MAVGPYTNPGTTRKPASPAHSGGYWTNTATGRAWIAPGGKVGKVQPGAGAITTTVNAALNFLKNPAPDNPKLRVAAMQRFLVHRGYNITVDGVRGPITNAAVSAF